MAVRPVSPRKAHAGVLWGGPSFVVSQFG